MSKLTNWLISMSEILSEMQAEKLLTDMNVSRREYPSEWSAKKIMKYILDDLVSQDTPMKKTIEEGMMVSEPFKHNGIMCIQMTSTNPPLVVVVKLEVYEKLKSLGKTNREIFNAVLESSGMLQKAKAQPQAQPQNVEGKSLVGGEAPKGKRI